MIAVIDYKAGNLTSVVKALHYLGAPDIIVTQKPEDVAKADKIVLPGVGHFQSTQLLTDLGLTQAIREAVAPQGAKQTPFLGICVGLQWLYAGSTEAPDAPGLAHFPALCERFPATYKTQAESGEIEVDLKSPHVGWNSLENIHPNSRLLKGIPNGSFVYYTHSWRAPISPDTAAATLYGGPFTAAVERDNVMGVQFHPEKSAETGLQVLQNFLNL